VEYYAILVEGQFPNYTRVIPDMDKQIKNPIRFNNKEMKDIVSIIGKFTNVAKRIICELDNDTFTIATDDNKAKKSMKIPSSNVKMTWSWNAGYFLDALNEEASVIYPDPDFNNHRVIALKRIGDSEKELILIMPMKID
jgi:DNA polymerase III sliding clamp (beta) subunit (PCNA family)